VNDADALPGKAAAILSAKAKPTTSGSFAYEASECMGKIKSGVDAAFNPPGWPLTGGLLGTMVDWRVSPGHPGKVSLMIVFQYIAHPKPSFSIDGHLDNPEDLLLVTTISTIPFDEGETRVLRCREQTHGADLAIPVVKTDSDWFLVLTRHSP
jgi:hypothetical protein